MYSQTIVKDYYFLESNRYGRVTIDDVKVDDFHHITKIEVTQRNTGK